MAAYWARQFEQVEATVTPEHFEHDPDGSITVTVRQVVRDADSSEIQSDTCVHHRWWLENSLVVRMEVLEPAD